METSSKILHGSFDRLPQRSAPTRAQLSTEKALSLGSSADAVPMRTTTSARNRSSTDNSAVDAHRNVPIIANSRAIKHRRCTKTKSPQKDTAWRGESDASTDAGVADDVKLCGGVGSLGLHRRSSSSNSPIFRTDLPELLTDLIKTCNQVLQSSSDLSPSQLRSATASVLTAQQV